MGEDTPSGPVTVAIGVCRCPGAPHPDGDYVILRDKPDLQMGLASRAALNRSGDLVGDAEAALYSTFIRYGIIAWNVTGEPERKGGPGVPVPVTHDNILARLQWGEGGAIVALRAMALYQDAVLDPLAEARSELQRATHVNGSTSASPASGPSTPN
jgi:hypothetical protein